MTDLKDLLQQALGSLDSEIETEWEATPAAVLIPILNQDGEWCLLFTRRTDSVESHAGQVSFPGGQIEGAGESAGEAALREAHEEIGLRPDDVQTLGQLNPLLTVTQFLVTPVVGFIPWPYPLIPNPKEVARTFTVPIRWLADPANLDVQERQPLIPGRSVQVHFYKEYDGETIWGVTARITLNLLEILDASGFDQFSAA